MNYITLIIAGIVGVVLGSYFGRRWKAEKSLDNVRDKEREGVNLLDIGYLTGFGGNKNCGSFKELMVKLNLLDIRCLTGAGKNSSIALTMGSSTGSL